MTEPAPPPGAAATPAAQPGSYRDLAGRTAIVTGGSRGIGAATAARLAENGAAVAVIGRDETALAAVTARITGPAAGPSGWPPTARGPPTPERMAAAVAAGLGPPDILAAFAGGNGMPVPTERGDARPAGARPSIPT